MRHTLDMNPKDVLKRIMGGENSRLQLKETVTNAVQIAQEMVAFSNAKGGEIIIGVNDKTGQITGLSFQEIQRINNLLATAATDHVKSPIVIETDTVWIEEKAVIVAQIPEGNNKPNKDSSGQIFIKTASDKRRVTSNEELTRLLQFSGNLYAEERIIHHATYEDLDLDSFKKFCEQTYKQPIETERIPATLENLRLGKDGKPTLAGALLFTHNPEKTITGFFIAAIWFWGNEIEDTSYRSSVNIKGPLGQQYRESLQFAKSAMHKVQGDQSFNSLGTPEIPDIVFEELLTNALIHRDYFVPDTIKLLIFENRVEIRSPGRLPNNLTTEQIRAGIRKKRNPILDSLAPTLLNYRGVGSGILRALAAYPAIDFINDTEGEQFTAIIHRPDKVRRN